MISYQVIWTAEISKSKFELCSEHVVFTDAEYIMKSLELDVYPLERK